MMKTKTKTNTTMMKMKTNLFNKQWVCAHLSHNIWKQQKKK